MFPLRFPPSTDSTTLGERAKSVLYFHAKRKRIMSNQPTPFRAYLHELFSMNEVWHFDDTVLASFIDQHFPDSKLHSPVGRHSNRMNIWRSEYNRGRFHAPPSGFSFRYANGVPVDSRLKPLSVEVIARHQKDFEKEFNVSSQSQSG